MSKVSRILTTLVFAITAQAYAIPVLSSTGGTVGSFDTNYVLVDGAGTPTGLQSLVVNLSDTAPARTALGDYWTGSSGEWISPFNSLTDTTNAWWSDSPPGVSSLFTFRTVIGGTGSGLVSFDIASDNTVKIFLNDLNSTPFELSGTGVSFANVETFSLNLSAGDILFFQVANVADPSNPDGKHGNPSGLLVRGNAVSVPDGGSAAVLMGLAFAAIGVARRYFN